MTILLNHTNVVKKIKIVLLGIKGGQGKFWKMGRRGGRKGMMVTLRKTTI
jgi:hypothetical protein